MSKRGKAERKKKLKFKRKQKIEKKAAKKAAAAEKSPPPTVYYAKLEEDHKFRWRLSGKTNCMFKYSRMIKWIRSMGTQDGEDYGGIRSLSCVNGHPLIQIEVIHEEKIARFLISRASLYILAFCCSPSFHWRVFKDIEFTIKGEGFVPMKQTAKYSGHPWRCLGPRKMIIALEQLGNKNDKLASKACMVFMVHICESARFYLVERLIQGTLIPSLSTWDRDSPRDPYEIQIVERTENDITPHLKKAAIVDLEHSVKSPQQLEAYIKKYSQLSKAWYLYILTDKKMHCLEEEIAIECGLLNTTALGRCLAVLCRTNLDKLKYKYLKEE